MTQQDTTIDALLAKTYKCGNGPEAKKRVIPWDVASDAIKQLLVLVKRCYPNYPGGMILCKDHSGTGAVECLTCFPDLQAMLREYVVKCEELELANHKLNTECGHLQAYICAVADELSAAPPTERQ